MKYEQDYLDFYEVYPRHEGKADGQKAWNSLSESDKAAAKADVGKRNRAYAWSSNKKLVALPATYLRGARFEDDWQSTLESSRKGDDLPNTGPLIPQVTVPQIEISWQERMLNRLFRSYVFCAMGLPEVKTALKLKKKLLSDEAKVLEAEEYPVQAETLAKLFVAGLDADYGLHHKEQALQFARRAK